MTAFVASLLFVTLAEIGDKTQLLAMAFAARFPARTVMAGVFAATLLNHALAVATGQLLTTVIPIAVISLTAAFSFVLFGLWTIRGDSLEGEDERPSAFGPFATVAVAFFLAEFGDKTQLATISLALKCAAPVAVLLGTTAGVLVGAPILARRRPGPLAGRIAHARLTIASGLLLLAIATQILIEHLP